MQERQQMAAQQRVELENRDARIVELEGQLVQFRAELAESKSSLTRLRNEQHVVIEVVQFRSLYLFDAYFSINEYNKLIRVQV